MARIRTIKPDFWTDEKVVELSYPARLLFIGLWSFADDEGRMTFSPKRIKMQVFPADTLDISGLFGEIRRESLITVYTVDNTEYLQINGFAKHQKIDKRSASKLPPHPNPTESPRIPPTEGIKEGNGNIPPIAPQGAGKSKAITFKTFLENCIAAGEKPISAYKPVFDYAEKIGLPSEFLEICWTEFKRRYGSGGTSEGKRYTDWRKVFRKAVESNWFKIWWLNPGSNQYELTTAGRTAERATA